MKTYATKLTGQLALALLVSAIPLFGAVAEQEENKTKTEQAAWSTRKKVAVGAVALGLVGGASYATYRFKPELVKTFGAKAVAAKDYAVNSTRALFGYSQPSMMDRARLYSTQSLRALGLMAQPETLKQKAARYGAAVYANVAPALGAIKEVAIQHPYAIAGSVSFAPSAYAGRELYVHYKPMQDVADEKATDETVTSDEQTVTNSTIDVSSAIFRSGSCAVTKPVKKSVVKKAANCPGGVCKRYKSRFHIGDRRNRGRRGCRRCG